MSDVDFEPRPAAWKDAVLTDELVRTLLVSPTVLNVPRHVSTPLVHLSALAPAAVRVAFLCNAGVAAIADEPESELPALQELFVDNNRLTSLPATLAARLPALQTLSLARNMFLSLESIAQFARVRRLDLRNNHLAPSASLAPLASCVALEDVSLSCCALRSIASLPPLPRLARLALVCNALDDLPSTAAALAALPLLRHVTLDGNPLVHRLHQLRARGDALEFVASVEPNPPADRHMFELAVYYRAVLRRLLPALLWIDGDAAAIAEPDDLVLA